MSSRADRPWPVHLIYLAEACVLLGWCRRDRIAHLHAHFGTNPAEVAMLVAALGGPTYSFTVHGPEEFDKPEFLHLGEKIRRSAFVVAISSFGRSQLFRWVERTQWQKVKVVHCGIEPAFHQVEVSPPSGRRLLCVGRLAEQKGHLLLIEAAALVAAQEPEFELVLGGDGELRASIEARIAELGLGRQVRITGWISSDQVRAEMLASRALVLASFAEGLPVVIMEAMALGRPVVTTGVAGIPELVQDGVEGWLVPAGDVQALANAMLACLRVDDGALKRMGDAARTRVLARHDVDAEAARLVTLFKEHAHV
jgi:glycosyltransferase involved in cell wall biosynthesis